jgi:general secretion pathway protein D
MKTRVTLVACACALLTASAFAQSSASDETVPVTSLISEIAKQTGKRFVVDPRVRGDILLIEAKPASLSYGEFLTVLQIHGFTAVEDGGLVRIVPDANVRQFALPALGDDDSRPNAEYVQKVLRVRTTSAAALVPILRPLLQQQAHLAASFCTNDLVILDTVANVRRIEAIVRAMDNGDKAWKPSENCTPPTSG